MAMLEKEQYNELIRMIDKAINLYKNTPLKFNEYKLYLSNGETLEFKFEQHQIAHLLGVNPAVLKGYISSTNSFESLEELVDNSSHIYHLIQMGIIDSGQLFSPFIKEKLDTFELLFSLCLKNISFVCKHDQAISCLNGVKHRYKGLYYIMIESEEKSVFLGIRPDERNQNKLIPVTSIPIGNDERGNEVFSHIISNQEIMLVNSLQLKNIDRKEFMSYSEKLDVVHYLNKLVIMFHAKLLLISDFEYILRQCLGYMEKDKQYNRVVSLLIESMKTGRKVTFESGNNNIKELINVHNETMGQRRYYGEIEELYRLKNELVEAQQQLADYERQVNIQEQIIENQGIIMQEQAKKIDKLQQFQDEAFTFFKKYQ